MAALSLNRIRAEGRVVLGFAADEGVTRLARLGEGGGYRVKFPVQSGPVEAVMVNTGGGMTGGDHLTVSVGRSGRARAPRLRRLPPRKSTPLSMNPREWMWRCRSARADASYGCRRSRSCSTRRGSRAVLPLIWPRMRALFWPRALSSGVALGRGSEQQCVQRFVAHPAAGRLVFAEEVRLTGTLSTHMQRPAIGKGARATATCLIVSPQAESLIEEARERLSGCRWRRG